MKNNWEYLVSFVNKHKFDAKVEVRCHNGNTVEDIQSVVFNKKDIPSGRRVSINDVKYDVDSDLPSDVFMQWITYLNNGGEFSYIDWMTKMDNQYTPIGIDNSEGEKLGKDIFNVINNLKLKLGMN